jgi:energy-coupling factor transporter transmembrane protein EcfT
MNWPIPDIPHKKALNAPSSKFWLIVLFGFIVSGTFVAIFLFHARNYFDVFINGILPCVLVWLCLLGISWFRYEKSSNAAILWDIQSQHTKSQWQRWAMWQRPIVANVILCPEEKGSQSLTGPLKDIPAYPKKCRALHQKFTNINSKLKFLDEEFERQIPGYRNYLYNVVVLKTNNHTTQSVSKAVFMQWDITPEILSSIDDFFSGADSGEMEGITLIIIMQDWPEVNEGDYSEFVTANLLCDAEIIKSFSLNIRAGVGRFLHSESLIQSLDMLIEYNNLNGSEITKVWLSGIEEADQIKLAQYADSNKWALPSRHPFLVINNSFGPPGPLSFPASISLLIDAAIQTKEMQLLISGNRDKTYSLCLITRKLFV